MAAPDANTYLILLLNAIGYVILWFRKSTKQEALMLREHRQMYADYKKLHNIRENGTKVEEA